MSDFDLREHIRKVLAETSTESLDDLTALVLAGIPKRSYGEALAQAMTHQVRLALHTMPRSDSSAAGPGTNSAGEGQATFGTHRPSTLPGEQNLRNSRIAIIRRNKFRENVWIGDGKYRSILECTVTDLEFAAEESHQKAQANAHREAQYRRLVKVMRDRKVEKVSELSDAEIEEALSDA